MSGRRDVDATVAGSAEPDPERAAVADWTPGSVVAGLYRVEALLGAGGMGQVHRVRHLGWNHDLAVKSPRPQLWAGEAGVEAFLDEARTWVDLEPHPHICACHYVRVLDGVPRIFSEFAAGGSVTDALRAGRIRAVADVLDVAIQMAWGLQAAHEADVVHQDVKPANVLLSADGRAMLTDFGLAGAQARAGQTRAGAPTVAPGESVLVTRNGMTPAYASPEQMAGTRIGRRSDLWSWAVSVLELFLGEVTWLAGPAAGDVLESLPEGETAPGRPPIPRPVAALLRDCLAADPRDRPRDMAAVAERAIGTFEAATGESYPRARATTVAHLADGWNNKALSLLDLGQEDEADRCWRKALEADQRHPDATFNHGLARWRNAEISDAALVGELEAVREAHPGDDHSARLLELVHRERGPETRDLTLHGHPDRGEMAFTGTLSVAVTPDERYAVSGGWDGKVRWWDLSTGECLRTIDADVNVVFVAVTSDARFVLCSGGKGREPSWWDLRSGRRVRRLKKGHTEMVDWAALTPDGRHALTASRDHTLRWWSLRWGRCRRVLGGHTNHVRSVAITGDGTRALSGSWDSTLRWWDLTTGRCLSVLTGHPGWVQSVAVSGDGTRGLSGATDGTVRLWDLTTGNCLRVLESGHTDSVESVSISADGRFALTGANGETVCWWDLTTGRCLRTFQFPDKGVNAVYLTAANRAVVAHGDGDGTISVLRLEPGEAAPWSHSLPDATEERGARAAEFHRHIEQARHLAQSDDLAATAAALRAAESVPGFARHRDLIGLWRRIGPSGTRTGLRDVRQTRTLGGGDVDHLTGAAITADGRRALSGGWDNRVRLWDLTTGECLREFTGRGPDLPADMPLKSFGGRLNLYSVEAVAITPDGRYGAAASKEGAIQTWDLTTGTELPVLTGHSTADAVAITPDGRRVLSGGLDNSVRLWDTATGECLRILTGHTLTTGAVAITPDGRLGLSGSWDRTARLWDLTTGQCRHVLADPEEEDRASAVAITPDGLRALIGSGDGVVRLYDLSSGRCLHVLTGHTSMISSVSITPDARHALTSSWDDTMRWWDLADGTCLRTIQLTGHVGNIATVTTTPDAQFALSAGWDGTMRLWEFDWSFDFDQPR